MTLENPNINDSLPQKDEEIENPYLDASIEETRRRGDFARAVEQTDRLQDTQTTQAAAQPSRPH